jgi:hypothetical protein
VKHAVGVQQQLDADRHEREHDRHRPALRQAEDPRRAIGRQQLREDDAVDREEQRDLDGEADQDHEARAARDRPQRGVAVEVQDERVDDLVGPVHQPERKAREHDAPVGFLDLDRVDVDGQRQQRDRRPVEQAGRTQQVLGFARELRHARREL